MSDSDIVLVHPPMSLDFLYGDLGEAGSSLPPQGLAGLAAVLREAGYKIKIIDSTASGLDIDGTVREIERIRPKAVGITVYTICLKIAAQIAGKIKAAVPETTIIVGGGHVSLLPGDALREHPEFDVGVIGEGEETLLELISKIVDDADWKDTGGIAYLEGGSVRVNERRPFIKDLDSLPLPAWDLLPELKTHYSPAADSIKRTPSTGIVTSRGCPGKCFFCNRSMFGNQTRSHSPDYIIRMMLDLMDNHGMRDIYIQDDTFTANKKNVMEFCRKLIDLDLDITWSCHARTDYVDLEMLYLMREAGCWQISFGIESGAQEILDNINKGTTVEQNYKALEWCRKAGISVKGLFMIGGFGESGETIGKTLEFIKKAHMTEFHMTFFTPMPQTVSWIKWPEYGTFDPENIAPHTFKPNFIPRGFTAKELVEYQKLCYRTFYLRPRIIWYFMKKMASPVQARRLIISGLSFLKYLVNKDAA